MDSKTSLGRRRRKRVRIEKPNKGRSPGGGLAREIRSRELGKGIEGEKGEEGADAREEGDEETGGKRGGGGGGRRRGGGGGSGGGGGGRIAVEVGGALIENFKVAGIAKP